MSQRGILTLIPFYNRRHTLLETLRSVEAQTLPPTQVVLVDDGSHDDGAEIAAAWIKQVQGRLDCRLIRKTNEGAAIARNHGLAQASPTEFVSFLDSDDCWPADFLERTSHALSSQPAAVAVTSDRQYVFADGSPSKLDDCSALAIDPALWMLEFGAGVVSTTLFRRSAIQRRGGFDTQLAYSEETTLFLSLTFDGPWLHVPGEPVRINCGSAQKSGDEENLSQKYADNDLTRAQIYENFFVRGGGHARLADVRCRQLLATRWYRAGRQQFKLGKHRRALQCFRKSRAWHPWKAKYYTRICRAWLASVGSRKAA